jgi:hypothetical protein
MRVIFCPRTCLNANTKQPAVPLGAVQEVRKLKRNLLAAAATSSILALAAAPLALAQGRHHHHGARHASAHNRHGHRAHLLTFGGSLGSTGPSGTAPTTGPPGAATVVSFTEETLTIELTSDKSLIKGKVTARTELECQPAAGTGQGSDDEQQPSGDDQDQSEGGDEGGLSGQAPGSGEHGAVAHSSNTGDDQGEEEDEQETCTTNALQPKAVVLRAELRIGDNGVAEWEKIELQK